MGGQCAVVGGRGEAITLSPFHCFLSVWLMRQPPLKSTAQFPQTPVFSDGHPLLGEAISYDRGWQINSVHVND